MAEVKISNLTAGTTLDGTELVPIVQGGTTVKMTTQDIADLSGGAASSVNLVLMSVVDGTQVTGTTSDTISYSAFIPANTLNSNSYIEIIYRNQRVGVSSLGTVITNIYKNTSNTLTGATQIANVPPMSTAQRANSVSRNFWISSNVLYYLPTAVSAGLDIGVNSTADFSSTTFDTTIDNYLLFTIRLANIADTAVNKSLRITSYE